jgi:hypothetical protein
LVLSSPFVLSQVRSLAVVLSRRMKGIGDNKSQRRFGRLCQHVVLLTQWM